MLLTSEMPVTPKLAHLLQAHFFPPLLHPLRGSDLYPAAHTLTHTADDASALTRQPSSYCDHPLLSLGILPGHLLALQLLPVKGAPVLNIDMQVCRRGKSTNDAAPDRLEMVRHGLKGHLVTNLVNVDMGQD